MRIKIIRNLFVAFFILVCVDLFYLQIIQGGYFHKSAQTNAIRVIPFESERGRILDREGRVLAKSVEDYQVVILPQDLDKDRTDEAFKFLEDVVRTPAKILEARFRRQRLTPFSPVTIVEGLSRAQAMMIEENVYRFAGVMVLKRYRRHYPYGPVTAHLTGYVGRADRERMRKITSYGYSADEPVGYAGVEQYFDDQMHGHPGGRQIEVNNFGYQVRLLSLRQPTQGEDVILSIDATMQKVAYEALQGRRGAVVILDSDTAEVLTLVSSPSYDPNDFVTRGSDQAAQMVQGYLKSSLSPLINRAISGAFPPGSTFKIPVAIAGLEQKKIKQSTTFNCPGFFKLGEHIFKSPHAFGLQDLYQAMGHSANEYFFHVGLMVGPKALARYAKSLGFGRLTGVQLPYESKGNIPTGRLRRWYKGDTVNMSIGQGDVLTTPIQVAHFMAIVANKGSVFQPSIIKGKKGQARRVRLDQNTWDTIHRVLFAPVDMEGGTARHLFISGLKTQGKTGTAQAGGDKKDHAWFVGITQSAQRRIAYCIFLEHGGSSSNAVELTREILVAFQEQGLI